MQSFIKLQETVIGAAADVAKAAAGNKSAGTRVRVAMQSVKQLAQQVRIDILKGE